MTHSEQINEIAAALAKAQAKIQNAAKTAENPGFKRGNKASTYADLASVWDACREHLTANGIAVLQGPETEGPVVTIETMLVHSSGQWFKDRLSATAAAAAPQQIGSGITYLRRYALAAMCGVAPADDDGEAAMGRDTPAGRPDPANGKDAAEKVRTAAAKNHGNAKAAPATPEERKKDLKARMTAAGIPGANIPMQLAEWIGREVDSSTVISVDDWMKANEGIEQMRAAGETLAKAKANMDAAFNDPRN